MLCLLLIVLPICLFGLAFAMQGLAATLRTIDPKKAEQTVKGWRAKVDRFRAWSNRDL